MTVPTEDLADARTIYGTLEAIGYDRAFSFEAKHDPFIPLAVAGEHTSTIHLGTAVAIAFARTPMTLAMAAWDPRQSLDTGLLVGLAFIWSCIIGIIAGLFVPVFRAWLHKPLYPPATLNDNIRNA